MTSLRSLKPDEMNGNRKWSRGVRNSHELTAHGSFWDFTVDSLDFIQRRGNGHIVVFSAGHSICLVSAEEEDPNEAFDCSLLVGLFWRGTFLL